MYNKNDSTNLDQEIYSVLEEAKISLDDVTEEVRFPSLKYRSSAVSKSMMRTKLGI